MLVLEKAPLLQLDRVFVTREGNTILRDISLVIPRGRHSVILGPNGAGKSSLLKLLLKQFYPSVGDDGQQGTVRILGQSDWELFELRRHMGVVASTLDFSFSLGRTGRMTALEAVTSGFTGTELAEFGLEITAEIRQQAVDALQRVEADGLIQRRVETLSTGERRRVLIARALVHKPSILVLDEPTTGLDIGARHSFLKLLSRLASEPGLTLVLVTHHVEEIIPEVDHVLLLGDGEIIFEGSKKEALTSARLSALFGVEVGVSTDARGMYSAVVRDKS